MKFREQERARGAFEKVTAVAKESWSKKYGRLCLRLPTLLTTNGLCQTLAFLDAKGKPEHLRLVADLAEVSALAPGAREFSSLARTETGRGYMRMTAESLRCALYFKRYAEAVLKADLISGDDE